MSKVLKRFLAFILVSSLFMECGGSFVFAQGNNLINTNKSTLERNMSDFKMSPQQKDFMTKLTNMFGEFVLKDGSLVLKRPIEEIKKDYSLNEFDISMLNGMQKIDNLAKNASASNIYIDDWKLCFDYGELNLWLAAAAAAGPEALIAAFEAIGTAMGGPIGAIVVAILAILTGGATELLKICGEILIACEHNWGWYIGVEPYTFNVIHGYIF